MYTYTIGDASGNEMIATFFERWNVLDKRVPKTSGIHWVNMYGAYENKNQASIIDNMKKLGNAMASTADKVAGGGIDAKTFYNVTPEKASQFKGRVLLNYRIEDKLPSQKYIDRYKDKIESFRRKIKPSNDEPLTTRYIFKALVVMGTEIPTTRYMHAQIYMHRYICTTIYTYTYVSSICT